MYSLPSMSIVFTEHPYKQETNCLFRFINLCLITTNGATFVSIFSVAQQTKKISEKHGAACEYGRWSVGVMRVCVCGQVNAATLSYTTSVSSLPLSILLPLDGLREVLIIEALERFACSKQSAVIALELDWWMR